jgi:hypothetical protein
MRSNNADNSAHLPRSYCVRPSPPDEGIVGFLVVALLVGKEYAFQRESYETFGLLYADWRHELFL